LHEISDVQNAKLSDVAFPKILQPRLPVAITKQHEKETYAMQENSKSFVLSPVTPHFTGKIPPENPFVTSTRELLGQSDKSSSK
jgi:hypothetical protein